MNLFQGFGSLREQRLHSAVTPGAYCVALAFDVLERQVQGAIVLLAHVGENALAAGDLGALEWCSSAWARSSRKR